MQQVGRALQVGDVQAHRPGLRLNVEVAADLATGHTPRVGRQMYQAVDLHQINLASVDLDAQLAALQVAHADAARVGLHRGAGRCVAQVGAQEHDDGASVGVMIVGERALPGAITSHSSIK